jgi:hypothetical protein
MNYQKVIEELEHHARESADFLAGFQDADEMESEKAAHRAMVCAVHALKQLTRQPANENTRLREKLRECRRHLRAANKGAERNALIAQLCAAPRRDSL